MQAGWVNQKPGLKHCVRVITRFRDVKDNKTILWEEMDEGRWNDNSFWLSGYHWYYLLPMKSEQINKKQNNLHG